MGLILECAEHIFSLSQLLQPLSGTKEDVLHAKGRHSLDLSKVFQFKLSPQLIIWVLIKKIQ